MGSVNKVILIGNLGKDPEVRQTQSGSSVATFSIATNESWNNREGQKEERTEWHRVVVFGKLADICGQYLKKGKQIYIEGRLQTRSWDDRDGNKKYTTEIVASQMTMLGRAGEGPSDSYAPPIQEERFSGGGPSGPEGGPSGSGGGPSGPEDDDIPF